MGNKHMNHFAILVLQKQNISAFFLQQPRDEVIQEFSKTSCSYIS